MDTNDLVVKRRALRSRLETRRIDAARRHPGKRTLLWSLLPVSGRLFRRRIKNAVPIAGPLLSFLSFPGLSVLAGMKMYERIFGGAAPEKHRTPLERGIGARPLGSRR